MARKAGVAAQEEDATSALERLLGHTFARPELLRLALTHRSFAYEARGAEADLAQDPSQDNEQLEYLGDAALGLLAAEALCRRFPHSREGELTRLRASVVSRKHLGVVGTRLGLGRWVRLGKGAEKQQARSNAALFSNVVEALIAALYLDGGIEAARRFVETEVLAGALPELERSVAEGTKFSGAVGDWKSALQELVQARGLGAPVYRLTGEDGPGHQKIFRIEVLVSDEVMGAAEGASKKIAQQEAARGAFAVLQRKLSGAGA